MGILSGVPLLTPNAQKSMECTKKGTGADGWEEVESEVYPNISIKHKKSVLTTINTPYKKLDYYKIY